MWLARAEQSGAALSEWLQMRSRPADANSGRMAAASMILRAAITPTEAMARPTVDTRCAAAVERGVRHAHQAAGEDRIAQGDGLQIPDLVLALRHAVRGRRVHAAPPSTGSLKPPGISRQRISRTVVHHGGVESLQSRKALNLLQDDFDLFVFELQRFQLLVHQIADLHDIGNSARIVAAYHLPGEPAQPARMAKRLQGMMQQGGLRERLCRDPGTTAEFDGKGRGPSAMCLFGGMVAAHRNTTI